MYRRIVLWCSEPCVGQAKPQLACACAHGSTPGSFAAQQTVQARLRRGTEEMPMGLGWMAKSLTDTPSFWEASDHGTGS